MMQDAPWVERDPLGSRDESPQLGRGKLLEQSVTNPRSLFVGGRRFTTLSQGNVFDVSHSASVT
jgi:hypothetical protein